MSRPLLISFFVFVTTVGKSNQCGDRCGNIQIPFPFFLNSSSCSPISEAFRLQCEHRNESIKLLFLNIGSQSFQVLQFFPDGLLVDFPNSSSSSSSCNRRRRPYNDLNAFGFAGNDHFGISADNVLGLYDCEDSSLCKAACEKSVVVYDDGGGVCGESGLDPPDPAPPACCYPLSDGTSWRVGEHDGFGVFSEFGCRGFTCWVIPPGSNTGKRGIKLEWAIPGNSSNATCAPGAYRVNATSVASGVRCECPNGYVGDAFTQGTGCIKSCLKNGDELSGKDCSMKRHSRNKVVIYAGVLTSAFSIASLTALFCLLKRPTKPNPFDSDQTFSQVPISFRKAFKARVFSYPELEAATKEFDETQKLFQTAQGTLHAGCLVDGSHVAVHTLKCKSEQDAAHVLSRVESLSGVPHRNLARVLGTCIESAFRRFSPMVVYEFPANGTLAEHLRKGGGDKIGLGWYQRLSIASEIANVLAFLQYEMSPAIIHRDLHSGCIFLDENFCVKIAGFGLPLGNNTSSTSTDVYNLGIILLEIIAGGGSFNLSTTTMKKIRNGKLEEVVDPLLYYHEQPPARREQIEIVADLATRCLLFGGDGRLGMIDAKRELAHVVLKDQAADGGSSRRPELEETFSNSSLLQMISMSPDSIYVP